MSIPLRNYSSNNHYFAHILAYAISLAWSERKYLDSQSLEGNMGWCRGLVGLCAHRYALREPEMLSTQGYLFKGAQPVCLPAGYKQMWPLHLLPDHTRAPALRPSSWLVCLSHSIVLFSPLDPYLVVIFYLYNLSSWKMSLALCKEFQCSHV